MTVLEDCPSSYLGVTVVGFSNYFMTFSPKSGLGIGDLLMILERQSTYFASCLAKMQPWNILALSPNHTAVIICSNLCDQSLMNTVSSEQDSS